MFLFTYTAAVLAFLCVGTAAFVFLKKRDSRLAIYFCWYLIGLAVWVGGNAATDLTTTDFTARLWSGICLIGGAFFISAYLTFAEYFIDEKPLSFLKKICFFGPTIVFSTIAFTPFYVQEVYITYTEPTGMSLGSINYAVLVFTVGSMLYALWRLINSYHKTHHTKQKQAFYLATGFSFLMIGASVFTIILPFTGEFRFFTLGPQFSLFTILLTAYAIFKHQLLDIKVVIQRGLIFTLLLTTIVSSYITILFLILATVETTTTLPYLISGAITTIIGIMAVPLIEKKLRRWTDKIFFKDKYIFSEAMAELGTIVSKFDRLDELTDNAAIAIKRILRTDTVYFSLTGEYTHFSIQQPWIKSDSTASLRQPLITIEQPSQSDESGVLHVPLVLEGEYIGVMTLGKKLSGDDYSSEDIHLMNTFSRYMSVALKKALLYQTVLDYSENLTKKVEERTKEIKTLQENQAQLMLNISHELQTPLTIIKGELGMMQNKIGDTTVFEKSVDRISTFIRALLRLAKIEAAGENTPKQLIDITALTREVVEYVTVMAEAEKITLTANIEENITTLGNREQLEQLITNLLSNAIKYIANNRRIILTAKRVDNQIQLTVEDSGIGISPENLPHLFKRFNRFAGTTKDGTGLGLALCDTIAKNHGGTITVQSELGRGTTVTVTLKSSTETKTEVTQK